MILSPQYIDGNAITTSEDLTRWLRSYPPMDLLSEGVSLIGAAVPAELTGLAAASANTYLDGTAPTPITAKELEEDFNYLVTSHRDALLLKDSTPASQGTSRDPSQQPRMVRTPTTPLR